MIKSGLILTVRPIEPSGSIFLMRARRILRPSLTIILISTAMAPASASETPEVLTVPSAGIPRMLRISESIAPVDVIRFCV